MAVGLIGREVSGSVHVADTICARVQGGGCLPPGKLADLVVLDRDPFASPAAEIGATRVLQTFVEGERVYAASDA